MKHCPGCRENKEFSEFGKNRTNYDGRQDYCRKCKSLQDKKYYKNNKRAHKLRIKKYINQNRLQLWKYLESHPCVDCGENNPIVLEFDHIKENKLFAVAKMVTKYSWINLKKEIAKCQIRCANCHRIKTAKQRRWYQFLNTKG